MFYNKNKQIAFHRKVNLGTNLMFNTRKSKNFNRAIPMPKINKPRAIPMPKIDKPRAIPMPKIDKPRAIPVPNIVENNPEFYDSHSFDKILEQEKRLYQNKFKN